MRKTNTRSFGERKAINVPCPGRISHRVRAQERRFGGRSLCIRYLTTGKEKKTENPRYPKTKQKKVKSHTPEKSK
jgi:hypothetical protein